jgi:hypothetical protein
VRSIEEETHEHTGESPGNGYGHDPTALVSFGKNGKENDLRESKETDSVEVDGFECSVTQSNTDGSTSDTHGGRDR